MSSRVEWEAAQRAGGAAGLDEAGSADRERARLLARQDELRLLAAVTFWHELETHDRYGWGA